jgi:hypothetical protein
MVGADGSAVLGVRPWRRALQNVRACRARRHARVSGLLLVSAVLGFGLVNAAGAAADAQPEMHFDHRIRTATVCFGVTNPAGGQSTLYGLRYTDRRDRADRGAPAIVLVHGIASSTENWDLSRTWSVARALAAAGYVVYSYDRLG